MLNSGTEACMAACRAARLATKKKNIVKMGGAYHGWSDALAYGIRVPGSKFLLSDGVPRQMSGNGGMCIVRGQKAPVIGRICMDFIMADFTGIDNAGQGDIATLIGKDGSAEIRCEDFAEACGTITNDILCRLGGRLPRVYV
jgi:serine/alanine racemase